MKEIMERLKHHIIARLLSFGYVVTKTDDLNIAISTERVYHYIMTKCNIKEIPKSLNFIFIERVCGEFFQNIILTEGVKVFLDSLEIGKEVDVDNEVNTDIDIDTDIELDTDLDTDLDAESVPDIDVSHETFVSDDAPISSIKIGDTTVNFAVEASGEDEIIAYVNSLCSYGESDLLYMQLE